MGGDDLNDEFLWATEPVVAGSDEEGSAAAEEQEEPEDQQNSGAKKRKSSPTNGGSAVEDGGDPTGKRKKNNRQQQSQPERLLLQSGRRLDGQDSTQQAAFLTTALQHYNLLEKTQDGNEQADNNTNRAILPSYCFTTKDEEGDRSPLVDRIRQAVSVQKMKKWKHVGSPCVVRKYSTFASVVLRSSHLHVNVFIT